MYSIVLAVHTVLAIVLVCLVLLQQGKGADTGAVMGAGGANSLFGVSGASSILVRLTTGTAILFMFTSVMLVRLSAANQAVVGGQVDPLQGSVMQGVGVAPAEPAAAANPEPAKAAAPEAVQPASENPAPQPVPANK